MVEKILGTLELIVKAPTLFAYSVVKWLQRIDNHKVFNSLVIQEVVCFVLFLTMAATSHMNVLSVIIFLVVMLVVIPVCGFCFVGKPQKKAQWEYVIKGNRKLYREKYKKQIEKIRSIEEKKAKRKSEAEEDTTKNIDAKIEEARNKDFRDTEVKKPVKIAKPEAPKIPEPIYKPKTVIVENVEPEDSSEISQQEESEMSKAFNSLNVDNVGNTSSFSEQAVEDSDDDIVLDIDIDSFDDDDSAEEEEEDVAGGEADDVSDLADVVEEIPEVEGVDISDESMDEMSREIAENNIDTNEGESKIVDSTVQAGFLGGDIDDDEMI